MEFPIVSRLPLSEGFSLSEEGRMESGGGGGKKNREGKKENEVAPVETRQSVGKKRERVVRVGRRRRRRRRP